MEMVVVITMTFVFFRHAWYCWRILTIENSRAFSFLSGLNYPPKTAPDRFDGIQYSI